MNAAKMLAIALIAGGVLGLLYGGFSWTQDTHKASIGPLVIAVQERQTVNVPVWAGVGAIVLGVGVLLLSGRGRG
jgi:uncharacterized membrane protein YidH (DUF202 family)